MSELFDLTGRVALVTGGGQGVGAGIANQLAANGAAVAVNDVDGTRAEQIAQALRERGGKAVAVVADVTDQSQMAAAVSDIVAGLGPIDVLVNNAGVPPTGLRMQPFSSTTKGDWDLYISINLYGVLICTQAVLASMVERGWGRLVHIVSDAGRVGERNLAVYAAAKAGAAGFSRSLAKEVGADGVTSNCLSLGWMSGATTQLEPELAARALRPYAIKRPGRPTDAAAAVTWLASDEAGWVTGQTISVSGGYVTT